MTLFKQLLNSYDIRMAKIDPDWTENKKNETIAEIRQELKPSLDQELAKMNGDLKKLQSGEVVLTDPMLVLLRRANEMNDKERATIESLSVMNLDAIEKAIEAGFCDKEAMKLSLYTKLKNRPVDNDDQQKQKASILSGIRESVNTDTPELRQNRKEQFDIVKMKLKYLGLFSPGNVTQKLELAQERERLQNLIDPPQPETVNPA